MANLHDALALHQLGWRVVASPRASKAPAVSWKTAQTEQATETELQQQFAGQDRNIFVVCGSISCLVVLDCDDHTAVAYWSHRLGAALNQTTCATSGAGKHYYFRLKKGEIRRSRSSSGGASGKWDLRAEGTGVIAPPSLHHTGRFYRWVSGHGPEALQDAADELWGNDPTDSDGDEKTRSLLSHLLAHPPAPGNRNNWLTQVAGHYAKHIPHRDAYEVMVQQAAAQLELTAKETHALIDSIWRAEQAQRGKNTPPPAPAGEGGEWRIQEPAEDTGWLCSGGNRILVRVVQRDNETGSKTHALSEWLNADMRVLGVLECDGITTYEVELRKLAGEPTEASLDSKTIADSRQLRTWLAGYGVSLTHPDYMDPRAMPESTRLLRYLRAQDAPIQTAVDSLGWHDEYAVFLTHEGVLTAAGMRPFETVRPHTRTRKLAPYHYGVNVSTEAAADVLREVLTFHHQDVAAVFGAWWAACLLKPQLTCMFSQFPFMALEAPSESGKSTGFFPLMMQLSGNTHGKDNPTRAALRDYLSAHRNGIVWVDDLDSLEHIGELLRALTGEGSLTKKASNQMDQVTVRLSGALVVSGEALGLQHQKALLDRAVLLEVPSPVGRRSFHGDYDQWADVVSLQSRHPVLADFAGVFVQRALGLVDRLPQWEGRLREGQGRQADKFTILRMGARILSELVCGDDWVCGAVDEWVRAELLLYSATDNTLTQLLLPEALRRLGTPTNPIGPDPARKQLPTPCFTKKTQSGELVVWFSPQLLANWWSDLNFGRIEERTTSEKALLQQARALGAGGKKEENTRRYFAYRTGDGGANYWRLSETLSALVIQRASGQT